MNKEKLQKAILYAKENPNSPFSLELAKRMKQGEFNDILKKEGIDTSNLQLPQKEGFFKKIGKALIKSETEFGQSIAGALDVFTGAGGSRQFAETQSINAQTIDEIIRAIKRKREKGEDTTKLKKLLKDLSNEIGISNELLERQAELSTKQVLGQTVGVAADIIGAGTIGRKAIALAKQPTSFLKGAFQGSKTGVLTGGGFGATQGLARGLQEDKESTALATDVISGGLIGGISGGVLGGLTGGVSGFLRGKAIRKAQILQELTDNPELVAKYSLDDTGKLVTDKKAAEALRQGLPEKQVAVIKNAAPTDKSKFKEMFSLAERASKDAREISRPSDIVGRTIVDRTKHLLGKVGEFGQKVEEAAKLLQSKKVDPTDAVETFLQDLDEIGVKFRKGQPIFDGSDIEGIAPAENLIKKLIIRMKKVGDDALEIHRLKKFIDEQVTFGKAGEGLTGQTEFIVKTLRRNLDSILDNSFDSYRIANTNYSKAIEILNDTKSVLGRNFNVQEGTVRAGSVARRILGNSAGRGDILEYLKSLQEFFKETGGKGDDDIISQIVFADVLEDIFGTQATTGLQGQVQRGIEQAGGVIQDIGQGQIITGLTRAGVRTFQALRGISNEAKIEALRKLIGL